MNTTLTIRPDGTATFVRTEGAEHFDGLGAVSTKRASRIEPVNPALRFVFRVIRQRVPDNSKIAAWTRAWKCSWRVAIIGGPTFGRFSDRQAAIDAEVRFLNNQS